MPEEKEKWAPVPTVTITIEKLGLADLARLLPGLQQFATVHIAPAPTSRATPSTDVPDEPTQSLSVFPAQKAGICAGCSEKFAAGDAITRIGRGWGHVDCA